MNRIDMDSLMRDLGRGTEGGDLADRLEDVFRFALAPLARRLGKVAVVALAMGTGIASLLAAFGSAVLFVRLAEWMVPAASDGLAALLTVLALSFGISSLTAAMGICRTVSWQKAVTLWLLTVFLAGAWLTIIGQQAALNLAR